MHSHSVLITHFPQMMTPYHMFAWILSCLASALTSLHRTPFSQEQVRLVREVLPHAPQPLVLQALHRNGGDVDLAVESLFQYAG